MGQEAKEFTMQMNGKFGYEILNAQGDVIDEAGAEFDTRLLALRSLREMYARMPDATCGCLKTYNRGMVQFDTIIGSIGSVD